MKFANVPYPARREGLGPPPSEKWEQMHTAPLKSRSSAPLRRLTSGFLTGDRTADHQRPHQPQDFTVGVWWGCAGDVKGATGRLPSSRPAREHAMAEFLAGRSMSPPVTGGGSVGLVCSPAGAGLRADAVAKLDGAWADVDRAARAAIDALVMAQAKAPLAPHWWDTAVPKFTGLFGVGDTPVKREFAAGVVRGFIDLGTANGNRTFTAILDERLDGWEKSHGINPHGGVHGIGGFASGLLIPGFGAEGLVASLAAKAANRALTQLAKEAATTLAAGTAVKAGRVFTSADAYVASAANSIEAAMPGRVVGVNINRTMTNGLTREVDIDLGNIIVQVKGGQAKGLTGQIVETGASTGVCTIGYAPGVTLGAWRSAAERGIVIARSQDELLAYLREFG